MYILKHENAKKTNAYQDFSLSRSSSQVAVAIHFRIQNSKAFWIKGIPFRTTLDIFRKVMSLFVVFDSIVISFTHLHFALLSSQL